MGLAGLQHFLESIAQARSERLDGSGGGKGGGEDGALCHYISFSLKSNINVMSVLSTLEI